MPKLFDLFDRELFKQRLTEKYIRQQFHPEQPLGIINYTELAQYANLWDEVTLQCRGLIYNYQTWEVVARPFKKFHNWDDGRQPYPPAGALIRSPKMDGSLGILYRDEEGYLSIATRGSFTSDQAIHATKILAQQMTYTFNAHSWEQYTDFKDEQFTYLFEIIYPENRIVVDYGDDDKLVLLDVIDNETGKADIDEFDRILWEHKVEKTLISSGFSDTMASDIPEGEEGFVLYWPHHDYRVKMKSAEYLRLHKIIFGLSERSVWASLGAGKTVEQICVDIPDEFHDWVKDVAKRLKDEQKVIEVNVLQTGIEVASRIGVDPMSLTMNRVKFAQDKEFRREFAKAISQYPYKGYLFTWLDGKDFLEAIWNDLRPTGSVTPMGTSHSEDQA